LLATLDLAAKLVLERGEPVDPGLDAERPAPALVDGEAAAPAVVAERLERRLGPARRPRALVAHGCSEHVVAVAEERRADVDAVAERALDRVTAAVHLGLDALDLDPRRRLLRLRQSHGMRLFQPARDSNGGTAGS